MTAQRRRGRRTPACADAPRGNNKPPRFPPLCRFRKARRLHSHARVASVRLADDSTRRRERAVELAGEGQARRGTSRGGSAPVEPADTPVPGARWIRRRFRDKRRARTVVEARDGGRHGQRAPDGVAARGRRSPGRSGASSFPARARVLARDRVRSRRRAPRSTLPAWSSPESSAGSRRVTRVVVTARSPLL